MISYKLTPLYSRAVALQQPFKRRPNTPSSHSGRCGVDKAFPCLESNCSLLTVPTEPAQCIFLFSDHQWLICAVRRGTLPMHLSTGAVSYHHHHHHHHHHHNHHHYGPYSPGGPWPPQANVASDLYPWHPPPNFYNAVSVRLLLSHQSILISVGHVLVDLQGLSIISF